MQGLERGSSESLRRCGLTHAQFDIIATVGNTAGMTYKQLGKRALMTKGTLTRGSSGWNRKAWPRACSGGDRRCFVVRLTASGNHVFERVFPTVVARGKQLFAACSDADFDAIN